MNNSKNDKQPLSVTHPDLAKEWDYIKNASLTPDEVTAGSNKTAWWKCSLGHEWKAKINNRTSKNSTGCPYCSNKTVLSGYNDLATIKPDLVHEWDYDKNQPLKPDNILAGSHKKVWWKCDKGHEWLAIIYNRTSKNGTGCPICAGKRVLVGFNDLASLKPDLVKEWDYEKNNPLLPNMVTSVSGKKVWWKCSNGHEWFATIAHRSSQNTDCPICTGKNVLTGYNDLATINPELVQEWNYEKNNPLLPNMVTPVSGKKVWWKCSKGHEWQATIANRSHNRGCPFCCNKQVLEGFNDLASQRPDIAAEWDYEKNNNLKPNQFTCYSNKTVWWKCSLGHEWKTSIANRSYGSSCSICQKTGTSKPEQGIAYYLSKVTQVYQRIKINNQEVDVFLPVYDIGIEYDGLYFHGNEYKKKKDALKDLALKNDIILFRVQEADINAIITHKHIIKYKADNMGRNFEWALQSLCNCLFELTKCDAFCKVSIDVKRDYIEIREQIDRFHKNNSLANCFPVIAKEWDYKKNGLLTPEHVYAHSTDIVWWKCPVCNSNWQAKVYVRTNAKSSGCPFCSKHRVIEGKTDLATLRPDLALEWDFEKNIDLVNKKKQRINTPNKVSISSGQKAWWKCSVCGNSWQARIDSRCQGNGCPVCGRKHQIEKASKPQIGINDLASKYPDLAKEWDYKKNDPLTPEEVIAGSHKKVWWICHKCGYNWSAIVYNRSSKKQGCPQCAYNTKLIKVCCIETGIVYSSIKDAEKQTGIKHISGCCNGSRKSAGGYHWKYVEEKRYSH